MVQCLQNIAEGVSSLSRKRSINSMVYAAVAVVVAALEAVVLIVAAHMKVTAEAVVGTATGSMIEIMTDKLIKSNKFHLSKKQEPTNIMMKIATMIIIMMMVGTIDFSAPPGLPGGEPLFFASFTT